VGTPSSLTNTTAMPPPTTTVVQDYNPQTIQPHQFHNYHPFAQPLQSHFLDPSQYGPRPPSGPGSPMDMGEDSSGGVLQEPGSLDGPPAMGQEQLMPMEGKQYDHEIGPVASERSALLL
jgi:hypothetical protein